MSQFHASIAGLKGKKARFYLGGGDRGFVQGPVERVDGNLIYIQKQGEIRGTMHTITVNADQVRFYEMDVVTTT